MPSSFQGINTLSSALEAFQTQMDVTGENIANVSTSGYTRQQANLKETPGSTWSQGNTFEIGNGVTVQSVTRIRDSFLQGSSNSAAADLGKANQQASNAASVESLQLATPTGGISSQLDSYFNAWSSLASDPTNANKLTVQQAGQTVADSIRTGYSGLESVKSSITQQIGSTIGNIQSDANQIADLNKQIASAQTSGASPNALMDQRDTVMKDLAGLTNVNVQTGTDGSYVVSTGNLILVDQKGARTVPTQFDAATGSLTDGTHKYAIQSGQLSGQFDGLNKVASYEDNLNKLADTLRTQVNGAYSSATNSAGQTGALFFSAGSGAASFDLDSTGLAGPPAVPGVKNDPTAIMTGTSGAASDVSVAQQIFAIGSASQASLGNNTPTNFFGQMVGQIGADQKFANNSVSTQQAVNKQVENQVQSVSGVNLDEEMSNLLRFQRGYQAAAQALSSMDQMIQTLLSTVKS